MKHGGDFGRQEGSDGSVSVVSVIAEKRYSDRKATLEQMEAVCYALLFADRVITENNGKRGLIGVFGAFNFQSFPALSPPWFIYAGVTNLHGTHEFSLNLVRDDAQHVVLPIAGEINAERADRDSEFIFPVVNLVFQKPGVHSLTFNIDGTQVASRILRVSEYSPSGEQQ